MLSGSVALHLLRACIASESGLRCLRYLFSCTQGALPIFYTKETKKMKKSVLRPGCAWRYFFSGGGGNSKPSVFATSAQPFVKRGRKARGNRSREKSVERLTIRVTGSFAKISIFDIHCKTERSISSARCPPSAPDTAVAKLLVMLRPMVESRCRVYCATTPSFGSFRSV